MEPQGTATESGPLEGTLESFYKAKSRGTKQNHKTAGECSGALA